jgi:hypothetical protein
MLARVVDGTPTQSIPNSRGKLCWRALRKRSLCKSQRCNVGGLVRSKETRARDAAPMKATPRLHEARQRRDLDSLSGEKGLRNLPLVDIGYSAGFLEGKRGDTRKIQPGVHCVRQRIAETGPAEKVLK